MADLDDTDNEPVRNSETIGRQLSIAELFDFTATHWANEFDQAGQRSFDEELGLYELLDLDGEGEDDVDIDIDDITEEILTN